MIYFRSIDVCLFWKKKKLKPKNKQNSRVAKKPSDSCGRWGAIARGIVVVVVDRWVERELRREQVCGRGGRVVDTWLIVTGEVPTQQETNELSRELAARGELSDSAKTIIDALPRDMHPMTQLCTGVLALQPDSKFAAAYNVRLLYHFFILFIICLLLLLLLLCLNFVWFCLVSNYFIVNFELFFFTIAILRRLAFTKANIGKWLLTTRLIWLLNCQL